MKLVTKLIAAAAITTIFAGPALAQKISIEQAKKLAADNGMTTVTEIEFDDGKWEIEGRDASNRKLEIDLNGDTGAVLKIEKD